MYGHIHRLASNLISTKESLEDVIGILSDRAKRDVKSVLGLSPERLFYQAATCARLDTREPPYIALAQGDFVNETARKFNRNRKLVFGQQAPMTSKVTKEMKQLVAQGALPASWLAD